MSSKGECLFSVLRSDTLFDLAEFSSDLVFTISIVGIATEVSFWTLALSEQQNKKCTLASEERTYNVR